MFNSYPGKGAKQPVRHPRKHGYNNTRDMQFEQKIVDDFIFCYNDAYELAQPPETMTIYITGKRATGPVFSIFQAYLLP